MRVTSVPTFGRFVLRGLAAAWVPLLLSLQGCDGEAECGEDCTPSSGDLEVDTAAGLYHLSLVPTPDPPVAGAAQLELTISTNADGSALTGATVTVDAWMPEHGHGLGEAPVVAEQGEGVYLASWTYSMPGDWDITITVDGAAGTDEAVVRFEVE